MAEPVDSREQLLKVAIDLFAAKGFRGTSIRDIANAMDMSISNIYHYFGSKEGLLLAILEDSSKMLLERLSQVAQLDIDPLERFKALLSTHIQLSSRFSREAKIFNLDEEHLSPEGVEANRRYQRAILDIYRHELETLRRLGVAPAGDAKVLAFNILGVINWKLRWYKPASRLGEEEVSRQMVDFILWGVMGRPGQGGGEAPA